MSLKLIGFFVFLSLCSVKSLVVKPQELCVPTQVVKGPCHKCICNADGVFVCHATQCPKIVATNQQIDHNDLPEIEDGQSCVAGKVYKMSCNTCHCGEKNTLFCTKMACFENVMYKEIRQVMKDKQNNETKKKIEVKKVRKDILRKGLHGNEKKKKKKTLLNRNYPQLPKGKCEPGMTYRNGCKKCFCNEKKVAKCTQTCSSGFPSRFNDKEISEMETRSVLDLPELPHMGAKCDPGRTYYVVCNICFCSHKQDLFCSAKYCVNMVTYADVLSKELTGNPCKKDFKLLCSECKCVNLKNQCKPIPNCGKNLTGKQLLASAAGTKVKLTLDIMKEKCKPHVSYKLHCNDCYCQSDGSLRCTQKVCLTYSQTKDLLEKETYLEEHGL